MIEENMVNTLLLKVGLPQHGTFEEKLARLNRNGYYIEGQKVETPEPEVAPEPVIAAVVTDAPAERRKLGRPAKVKNDTH